MRRAGIIMLPLIALFIFAGAAGADTYSAEYVPWSGYWWPLSRGGLVTGKGYQGHPAPVEKYDLATTGSASGPATAYGMDCYYDRSAAVWEGYCFAWAAAAVREREPALKGIRNGVVFQTGDKKGILTAAYDGARYTRYPIQKPEDFHQLLETFIRGQGIPIVIDLGTDIEIWYYPLYRYDISHVDEGNRRHYTVTIHFADDNVHPDYVGTRVDTRTYFFFYDLSGNLIVGSDWEKGSEKQPPIDACEVYGTVPRNPGIDLGTAREIAYTVDDPYEPNDDFGEAFALAAGEYLGIAADGDFYRVGLHEGDRMTAMVEEMDADGPVSLRVYRPDGSLVAEGAPGERLAVTARKKGDYVVEVVPGDGAKAPVYRLLIDQKLPWAGIFPADMAGMWQGGYTVFDPEKRLGRVFLSRVSQDGTVKSSVSLEEDKSYFSGLLRDLPLGSAENGYIRVDADYPHRGAFQETYDPYLTIGCNVVPLGEASPALYFPHIAQVSDWSTLFGLVQTGSEDEEIEIVVFDAGGRSLSVERVVMRPGEKREDERFSGMFPLAGNTVVARALSGQAVLIGYLLYKYEALTSRGHALIPVMRNAGSSLSLSHAPCSDSWWTGVAVLNIWERGTNVRFQALDGSGETLALAERRLPPRGQLVTMVSALFDGVPREKIASLTVRSLESQPLAGLAVYGNRNGFQIDGLSLSPVSSGRTACLPLHGTTSSWWTGFSVRNEGEGSSVFQIDLIDEAGESLAGVSRILEPRQTWTDVIEKYFGPFLPAHAGYVKITSEECPFTGLYMVGSPDETRMWGDTLAF